jgi:outer membrane protein OmpA-like peptidoglycan-associated protein
MISGMTAKYVFAACLGASVADLVVVDLVLGPVALRPQTAPAPAPAAVSPEVEKRSETPVAIATATPAASNGGPARAPRPRPRVVARFESDQPTAGDQDLRALAAAMLADPSAEIVLEGHTDQRGDTERNRALSVERATWAQRRLVELGVSASRIAVVGLGAERPLERGDDDAAVAGNRRVEVRWLTGSPSSEDN